jgi:SAM-dependent methyltransferase
MAAWSEGYVTGVEYIHNYVRELNPLRVKWSLANAGIPCPEIENACELGFGQGLSINAHSSASQCNWFGTDFNSSQVNFANGMAQAAGLDLQLADQSFSEFCSRQNLPDFDFIGLHGVWSWVTAESRELILDFIHRKLKPGGVLFVSYDMLPGGVVLAPVRHLMVEHAKHMGFSGTNLYQQIHSTLSFCSQFFNLASNNPVLSPIALERFERLKFHEEKYLIHDYFNKNWAPQYFTEISIQFERAKLSFATSSNHRDSIDAINLTGLQKNFINQIDNPALEQLVRDFILLKSFRLDYWIKGIARLTTAEQASLLRNQCIVLVKNRNELDLKITGALGSVNLTSAIYEPIVDCLSNHKPKSLNELECELQKHGFYFSHLQQACAVLVGLGYVDPANDLTKASILRPKTDGLNKKLLINARSSGDTPYLVSPVTGGAIEVSRIHQLFAQLSLAGCHDPAVWVEQVDLLLGMQGQGIVKSGNLINDASTHKAALLEIALEFQNKVCVQLKALQVI